LIKEIKSRDGELHFKRWRIIETPWFSIYIHGIYKADEDKHMHDHPWNYTSFVLRGFFSERMPARDGRKGRYDTLILGPGKFVGRKAEQFHKIEQLHSPSVYTLFFTGRRRRDLGYLTEIGWMDHKTYRKKKHE
jgi:hypothetical protein